MQAINVRGCDFSIAATCVRKHEQHLLYSPLIALVRNKNPQWRIPDVDARHGSKKKKYKKEWILLQR